MTAEIWWSQDFPRFSVCTIRLRWTSVGFSDQLTFFLKKNYHDLTVLTEQSTIRSVHYNPCLRTCFYVTQAIDLDPNEGVLLSNRSLCWLRLGQGEHALEDAKACRALMPDWHKACYREGAALRLLQVCLFLFFWLLYNLVFVCLRKPIYEICVGWVQSIRVQNVVCRSMVGHAPPVKQKPITIFWCN